MPKRLILALLLLGLALPVPKVAAEPVVAQIKLSPTVGPPTTSVAVKGKEFAPNEGIRLFFDDKEVQRTMADGIGRFSTRIRIPRSAIPGDHTATATGYQSGSTAQATFTVRTDWTRFHFDLQNTGHNPYENVLDPESVRSLVPKWTAALGSEVSTSPAVVGGTVYVGLWDGTILALDKEDGRVRWANLLDMNPTDPTVVDGTVFGLDPVRWTPEHWTFQVQGRESPCREPTRSTRPSSGLMRSVCTGPLAEV